MDSYLRKQLLQYVTIPQDPNIAIFIMGIPGSGKTTICQKFITNQLGRLLYNTYITKKQNHYNLDNFILCNSDEIIKELPDYQVDNYIDFLHIGRRLNNKLLKILLEDDITNFNFVYDATGKQYENYLKKIKKAKSKKYFTILIDVRTDILTCYQRILFRDRHVSLEMIEKKHEDIYTPKHYTYNNKYEILNNYDIIQAEVDISIVIDNNQNSLITEINSSEENISEELSNFVKINI